MLLWHPYQVRLNKFWTLPQAATRLIRVRLLANAKRRRWALHLLHFTPARLSTNFRHRFWRKSCVNWDMKSPLSLRLVVIAPDLSIFDAA
ncbi:MAG: hypothetical protein ABIQ90_12295, partial [Polaromonas sp.]